MNASYHETQQGNQDKQYPGDEYTYKNTTRRAGRTHEVLLLTTNNLSLCLC